MTLYSVVCAILICHLIFCYAQADEAVIEPDNVIQNTNFPSKRLVHDCHLTNDQYAFNVLPGSGWDNLANQELGQVLKLSYKKCKSSNDASFLIPDEVILSPEMASNVQLDSDLVSHFSKYDSMTSKSINMEANAATPNYQVSGSFSFEKKDVKKNQMQEKSEISHSQLRYELYHLSFQPDSELDSTFLNRIVDMGIVLEKENKNTYSEYLADLIVRDYGTHVIRSVAAGAILSKTDVLKGDYMSKFRGDSVNVSVSASVSMRMAVGIKIGGNYANSENNAQEYEKNCASSRINTFGGGPYGSDFKLEDWEKTLPTNLVAIDRTGDPLYYVITKRNVPFFNDKTIFNINTLIKEAINRYYSANTRPGCMDIKSENFDENANIDNGICQNPDNNFRFGGVYQECFGDPENCKALNQPNPATGQFSCPDGFDSVDLFRSFSNENADQIMASWCAPNQKSTHLNGYLFGGLFNEIYPNPITGSFSCPEYFIPLKLGHTTKVCVSQNRDFGLKNSLSFGGFFSCLNGNPLTQKNTTSSPSEHWLKSCAPGYSAHMASIDTGCQISYCLKSNALKGKDEIPLYRPPFTNLDTKTKFNSLKKFQTSSGIVLKLSNDGMWNKVKPTSFTQLKFMLIFFAEIILILAIFLVILAVRWIKS